MAEAYPALAALLASAAYLFGFWVGFRKGTTAQNAKHSIELKKIIEQKQNEYEVLRQAVKRGDTVSIFGCPYVPGYPENEQPPARERMN